MARQRGKKIHKPVAFRDGTVAKEELPYPYVFYPGHYGTYIGFKQDEDDEMTFCSCSKQAICHYIEGRIKREKNNAYSTRNFILDSMDWPIELVQGFLERKAPDTEEVYKHLHFADNLCHECNKVIPTYEYCSSMYGSKFKVTYGWYINKQFNEFGLDGSNNIIVPDAVPEEIHDLFQVDPREITREYQILRVEGRYKESSVLEKQLNKQARQIENYVEDVVRKKLGHKKIGKAWTNETILFQLIQEIYPNQTVIHHYRADFLENLELDIFVEDVRVGIEYQGIQHFKPIKHWGGEKALKKTQERDKKKKQLCKVTGVPLVYFYYDEDLTHDLVRERLDPFILRETE